MNPAIDRIISVDRLAFEDRAYVNSSRDSAGGRGINASCVIHSFGGKTTAVFPCGGDSGKRLENLQVGCGYCVKIVPIDSSIRTNMTITDRHGLTVNLNEKGPTLTKAEVAHASDHPANAVLFVVQAVRADFCEGSWHVAGGTLHVQWPWTINHADLQPIQFVYRVVPRVTTE